MGSLGDNLLKLTDFPFSYSFISLLTSIFLGEGLLDQPPETLASLLILMGFVATTLAITDPIGDIQKIWLKRLKAEDVKKMPRQSLEEIQRKVEKKSLMLRETRNWLNR